LASTHIINQSTRKAFDIYIIFGGTISGLSFTLIAMASINNSLNWLTPAQNICFAVGFFTLSIIGIDSLWKNRTVTYNEKDILYPAMNLKKRKMNFIRTWIRNPIETEIG